MDLPKFLLGDNTDYSDNIFIIHTEFPRFIINLIDDEIEWLEDFQGEDQKQLESEVVTLIDLASKFYDREMERYKEE
ncbi:hypothetical protein Lupro_00725 [Lutibacter profundi]|uniref:Uncharacterized protein n=1 Tax=Lutibacter profundi TaxID=1622118 RepID=A0A0X8G4E2_9FLAO|nr:hypothetical protein [Lutibacter profundi]AMC09874.1 hypothetical protein Lupro_00725 [Lutibacter profundi]